LSREVVVNLIGSTTTKSGLKIKAALDERIYPTEQKVSDKGCDPPSGHTAFSEPNSRKVFETTC
jgi:hypothetical protein